MEKLKTILVLICAGGVILLLIMFSIISSLKQTKELKLVRMERDSLKAAKFIPTDSAVIKKLQGEVREWREKAAIQNLVALEEIREKEMSWEEVAILRLRLMECWGKRWPPDSLLHRPMKREK